MGTDDSNQNLPTLKEDEAGGAAEIKSLLQKFCVKSGWIDALNLDECFNQSTSTPTLVTFGQQPHFSSDLIVVLDLDDCLVHTVPVGKSLDGSNGEEILGPVILLRPGLVEILRTTMARYETHVFTASESGYADFILDALVKVVGLPFAGRWYRQHCTKLSSGKDDIYTKDLGALVISDSLCKMVLVDNNVVSFRANPSNGIPIRDFGGDASDESLKSLTDFLSTLETVDDVRPLLDKRFGVESLLEKYTHFSDWFSILMLAFDLDKRQL
jgi:Dullard-like phosphatase family protein